jgi:hypothetical protein
MEKIILLNGEICFVDDEDFQKLNQFKWYLNSKRYACRHENGKTILMHREIMGNPIGYEIDHINGNGLKNTKDNLRICTHAQNLKNIKQHIDNTSGYKGVYYQKCGKRKKRWYAQIQVNGKTKLVGYYLTPEEAALAYNNCANIYYGEYAKLNEV